jgi:glycosyltransferase involved in cell wall biosynthesis
MGLAAQATMTENAAIPLVSVIIAVYNGAAYVENAVPSALAQQDCDTEVIIDDASEDQSRDIVDTSRRRDLRLARPPFRSDRPRLAKTKSYYSLAVLLE